MYQHNKTCAEKYSLHRYTNDREINNLRKLLIDREPTTPHESAAMNHGILESREYLVLVDTNIFSPTIHPRLGTSTGRLNTLLR